MSDLDLMMSKYPSVVRDPTIRCGVCDPNSQRDRLTTFRYDTALLLATLAAGPPGVMTFAAQTVDLFVTGKDEALGGLATATKGLSLTNLGPSGAAPDSPCLYTAYGIMFELGQISIYAADGSQSNQPQFYYDQAYNNQVLTQLAKAAAWRIVEPNGCTDDGTPLDLAQSDGSARGVGDKDRSGMLGVMRGLRTAVCFPGENARKPKISVTLDRALNVTENGASPFLAFGVIPAGSVLAVPVRVTLEGSIETPP